ncbi:hypothetical protein KM043_014952 [Ampulex compressa]|nr:hypothetical protein KM043_014952 [Ampulex compressa]
MFAAKSRLSTISSFLKRQVQSNAELLENCTEIRNRNPRNLERLRIARKPVGFKLEKNNISYWHKLVIRPAARRIVAEVQHYQNGPVITVSSTDWYLRKQLYRTTDATAYISVGRVLAHRCLQSGIVEMFSEKVEGQKTNLLVEQLESQGILLQEPSRYWHPDPWTDRRPEKPWETFE